MITNISLRAIVSRLHRLAATGKRSLRRRGGASGLLDFLPFLFVAVFIGSMVLRAIFLGTQREVQWAFVDGPCTFRPELFAAFRDWLPQSERHAPLDAYVRRLTDRDAKVRAAAAHVWNAYERILSEVQPSSAALPQTVSPEARVPPTPVIEAHYITNAFFLEPGQLLANAGALTGIPGTIVQGRYDLLCPPANAYALAAAWRGSELQIIDTAGHAMTEPGIFEALREGLNTIADQTFGR